MVSRRSCLAPNTDGAFPANQSLLRISIFRADVYNLFGASRSLRHKPWSVGESSRPHLGQDIQIAGEVITVFHGSAGLLAELSAKFGIISELLQSDMQSLR